MRTILYIFWIIILVSCERRKPELIMDFEELILDSVVHDKTSYFSIDLKI